MKVSSGVARQRRWLTVAVLGLLACLVSALLPWRNGDFRLGVGTRLFMACVGAALIVVVARRPRPEVRGVLTLVSILGICVLVYPTLMTLSAAGVGGSALAITAAGWHTFPLILVQLTPVVASSWVLRRRGRRWVSAILLFAMVSTAATVLVLAGAPGRDVWFAISTATFLASFGIAPLATWLAVARTSGESRRRNIMAAVAAMYPVVIIVGCTALGALAAGLGADENLSVTALLVGFSIGVLLCGLTVVATTAPSGSTVLHTRVLVFALDGLAGTLFVISGLVVGLALPAEAIAPGWSVLAGAASALVLLVPWLRLRTWIARVVDPTAELQHELTRLGAVAAGQQRPTVLLVLRRLADDPELVLVFRVEGDAWVDAQGASRSTPPDDAVVLARRAGDRAVVACTTSPDATARVTALGDLTSLLQPALLEAAVVYESARAERAAEHERHQLERDLHDGLQGRLLGLALHLQLSSREVDDPSARLLLSETVESLRSTVEDVRALGGGRQPELLGREGLAPALAELFRHARPLVELDIPEVRFPSEAETTAYFVVGEAVSNALKHAAARRVQVSVRAVDSTLTVTVSDDGRGGADPRLGSGLRGSAERVAAGGGALVVREREPRGTVVEMVLPCGS